MALFDILNVNPAQNVQPFAVDPTLSQQGLLGLFAQLGQVGARGVAQAAGRDLRSPQARVNQAAQGLDANSAESLRAVAERLNSIGETQRATALMAMADQVEQQQLAQSRQDAAYGNVATALTEAGLPGIAGAVQQGSEEAYNMGIKYLTDLRLQQNKAISDALSGTGADVSIFKGDTWVDDNGNYYTTTTIASEAGQVQNVVAPIGSSPVYSGQNLTAVGGQYNLTPDQDTSRMVQLGELEEQQKQFVTARSTASIDLPVVNDQLLKVNTMLELLNQINTGGWSAQVAKAATDFFGVTVDSVAMFEQLGRESVLGSIRSLGSNPTEGERRFVESLAANIGNTRGLNLGILQAAQAELQRRVERARYLTSSGASTQGYFDFINEQYRGLESVTGQRRSTVSFSDLPE